MMKNKYEVKTTTSFRRDLKIIVKRGYNQSLLEAVVLQLAGGKQLEPKYKDHALKGDYTGFRECHITPDWLLVYFITENVLTLTLSRTGTHSDLF